MKTLTTGIAVLVAGVLVLVAAFVAADRALDDPAPAAATVDHTAMSGASTAKGTSFAGAAPADAAERAKAPKPFPAVLPPLTPGDVVKGHMVLKNVTIEIAPGIEYQAWGF